MSITIKNPNILVNNNNNLIVPKNIEVKYI